MRKGHRRKHWLLGLLVLFAVTGAGVFYYLTVTSARQLQEALAEADRSDPAWRILELEAARRKIPDEENSGSQLMNAKALLSTSSGARMLPAAEFQDLEQSARNLEAPVLLDEQQLSALRTELKRSAKSLAEVYKIADKPRGRFPISYTKDFIGTLLPNTQATRDLANLLDYDAMVRAHDQDMDSALLACRCLIHVQRAIGDEPTAISMLVRMAIHQMAIKRLERVLAQGQPSEASMHRLQQLLEEELNEPLFLIAARGERGGMDSLLEALQKGEIKGSWQAPQFLAAPGQRPSILQSIRFKYAPGSLTGDRAALLRFNNLLVEFAKLPVDEQRRRIQEFNRSATDLPPIARALSPDWPKLLNAFHRDQASLRSGVLLLAAERYRRAHHRWPERLDDLVSQYLAKVPLDPFDGEPMRLGRFGSGIVIYSVSLDGQDNGGKLSEDPTKPGTDWGFRLWDVSKRRQAGRPQ